MKGIYSDSSLSAIGIYSTSEVDRATLDLPIAKPRGIRAASPTDLLCRLHRSFTLAPFLGFLQCTYGRGG